MAHEFERGGERRKGRRRRAERGGSDRRHAKRRAAAGVALGVASLAVGAQATRADVYSRINSKGVLEATNVPASPQDFKLTYRSKGTLVHSAGFACAPRQTPSSTLTSMPRWPCTPSAGNWCGP